MHSLPKDALGGPFEAAEATIAEVPAMGVDYAKSVLGGKFEAAEGAIAKSAGDAVSYAKDAIGSRFQQGEEAIFNSEFRAEYSETFGTAWENQFT